MPGHRARGAARRPGRRAADRARSTASSGSSATARPPACTSSPPGRLTAPPGMARVRWAVRTATRVGPSTGARRCRHRSTRRSGTPVRGVDLTVAGRARWSRCSARAAAARRRCCAPSPGWSAPTRARCASATACCRARHLRAGRAAPDRDGLPGRRALPPPERGAQRRATASPAATPAATHRVAEALALVGLAGLRRPRAGDALRRPAAAGGAGARAGAAALGDPARRALLEPRRTRCGPSCGVEVRRMLTAIDATGVFVTHDQEEAFVVGDEVAVMDRRVVAQQGEPRRALRAARHPRGRRVHRRRQLRARRGGRATGAETPIGRGPAPRRAPRGRWR